MTDFLTNYGVFIFIAFVLISIIYVAIFMNIGKKQRMAFLSKNPNPAKLYFKSRNSIIFQLLGFTNFCSVTSDSVSGGNCTTTKFTYFTPGEHELEVTYSSKRPGIILRSVGKTFNGKLVFLAEANKSYELSFHKKTESFKIQPINK